MPHPTLDWSSSGAWRGEDPELFFPIATTRAARQQVREAKAVCFRCAVRVQCLTYATETGQHGIWGGTTTDERLGARHELRPLGHARVRPLLASADPAWSAPATFGPGRSDVPVRAAPWSGRTSRV
jgi:WhiB family transcriptional regulator, redox-sensing transcriptional regulator